MDGPFYNTLPSGSSTMSETSIQVNSWPSLQPLKGHCAFQLPEPTYHPPNRSKKSHARKRPAGHIPRPRNAFILFRCDFVRQKKIPESVENDHRNISRIVGKIWQQLSISQRRPWTKMAEMEKIKHLEQYPDFSFASGARSSKKKVKDDEELSVRSASYTSDEQPAPEISMHRGIGPTSHIREQPPAGRTFAYNLARQDYKVVSFPNVGDLIPGPEGDPFMARFDAPHPPIPDGTENSYREYYEPEMNAIIAKRKVKLQELDAFESSPDFPSFQGILDYLPRGLVAVPPHPYELQDPNHPASDQPLYDTLTYGEDLGMDFELSRRYVSPSHQIQRGFGPRDEAFRAYLRPLPQMRLKEEN